MNPPRIGTLPAGPRDAISDVGEIRVGHVTLDRGGIQTGVTVVVPHAGDPFAEKIPAAAAVINGFGKSVGLLQVEELGVFETPIALTNTFSLSAVMQAQIREAMAAHPRLGREWATVNPLVFECNDGYLNDIRALAVTEEHYRTALTSAAPADRSRWMSMLGGNFTLAGPATPMRPTVCPVPSGVASAVTCTVCVAPAR